MGCGPGGNGCGLSRQRRSNVFIKGRKESFPLVLSLFSFLLGHFRAFSFVPYLLNQCGSSRLPYLHGGGSFIVPSDSPFLADGILISLYLTHVQITHE